MEFPRFVYKSPGRGDGQNGKLYDYEQVSNDAEMSAKLADGWHATRDAAMGCAVAPADVDALAPTRSEMEQKARELGLKFDGRTTDRKLSAMIAERLGE